MSAYKGGKQYTLEDIQTLYQEKSFESWDDVINYLEEHGREVLLEAKVGQILFDLKKISQKNVPFVKDPYDAFRLLQEEVMIHRFQG